MMAGDGDFLNMSAETTEDSLTSTLKSSTSSLLFDIYMLLVIFYVYLLSKGTYHCIPKIRGLVIDSSTPPKPTIPQPHHHSPPNNYISTPLKQYHHTSASHHNKITLTYRYTRGFDAEDDIWDEWWQWAYDNKQLGDS